MTLGTCERDFSTIGYVRKKNRGGNVQIAFLNRRRRMSKGIFPAEEGEVEQLKKKHALDKNSGTNCAAVSSVAYSKGDVRGNKKKKQGDFKNFDGPLIEMPKGQLYDRDACGKEAVRGAGRP